MHMRSFSSITLVVLFILSLSATLQAQNPPVFTGGPPVTPLQPTKMVAADFNNDGVVDLIAIQETSAGISVVIALNHGNGTYGAPTSIPAASHPSDLAIGDFNGDGNLDLAITNRTTDATAN